MDFFKVKGFRKARKPVAEKDLEDQPVPAPEDMKMENGNQNGNGNGNENLVNEEEEDDDDDFILNEVKKRMKELRRNSFMNLIPEESVPEEEDDETTSSSGGFREMGDINQQLQFCSFDSSYEKYCELMLFFDRMIVQRLNDSGNNTISTQFLQCFYAPLAFDFGCYCAHFIDFVILVLHQHIRSVFVDVLLF